MPMSPKCEIGTPSTGYVIFISEVATRAGNGFPTIANELCTRGEVVGEVELDAFDLGLPYIPASYVFGEWNRVVEVISQPFLDLACWAGVGLSPTQDHPVVCNRECGGKSGEHSVFDLLFNRGDKRGRGVFVEIG